MGRPNGTGRLTAPESLSSGVTTERWSGRYVVALIAVFVAGIAIRIALFPGTGLKGDIDQFVVWVNHIAVNGLGNAYDQNITFGPVMAYIWGALAAIEPAFRTATDSSDPCDSRADEGPGLAGGPRDRRPDGLRIPVEASLGGDHGRDRAAPPGHLRCERVVGPIREHLLADRARGTGLRAEWPQRARRRRACSCGDDQAAGPAVPAAVRRLVLDARRMEGDSSDRSDRAGGHRRPVAAVRGGGRARPTT